MQLQKLNDTQKNNVILASISISKINPSPFQARKKFDATSINELAQSIKANGLLQPVVVRQTSYGAYELVAGERRLRACKIAHLQKINAILIDASDEQSAILCMIENVQRQQLHFFEIAQGYIKLIQVHQMTQERLAKQLGIQQSTIANKIRVLRLSESIKDSIIAHNLTERHARALLRLPTDKIRQKILNSIIKRNLNVTTTDALVHSFLIKQNGETSRATAKIKRLYSDWRLLSNSVKSLVVKMQESGANIRYTIKDLESTVEMTIVMSKALPKKASDK